MTDNVTRRRPAAGASGLGARRPSWCLPGRTVLARGRVLAMWPRRLLTVLALLPVSLLTQLGVALAGNGEKLGQTPAALSWITLNDSSGTSVWNYELSLDRGGVTSPGKVFWSSIIDIFWQLYRGGVVIAIWFIDWALSFDWLPAIVSPVMQMADSLTSVMQRIGGTGALLTVTAIVAVCWMMRGKWTLGVFELFLSLVIASLATGALASPVALVAGPSGVLMDTRQFGLEVADGLANGGGATDADTLRKATTARLVDTFVRLPLQTINFGTVVDGTSCQAPYDSVIKAGPYGMNNDIRDAMKDCNSDLGEVAENPGAGQALSAIVLSPAALLVMGFATVLAGTVFLASMLALYQSLRAIVTLISGVLPGSARGALWMTAADLTMALVTLVFAITFLSGYLLLIASVFTNSAPGQSPMQTFFFVDVLLVAALLLFWRGRKSIQRASTRLAQALATRPSGAASALPAKRPFDAAGAYYKARMAGAVAGGTAGALAGPAGRLGAAWVSGRDRAYGGLRNGLSGAGGDLRAAGSWMRSATASPPSGPSGPGGRPHGGPGPALPRSGPGGPGSSGPGGASGRLGALLGGRQPSTGSGRLVRGAGQLALAAATGGTSAVATTAGKSALTATVSRQLRAAPSSSRPALIAGPQRTGPQPSGPIDLTKRPTPAPAAGTHSGPGRASRHPTSRVVPPSARPATTLAGSVIDQDGTPQPDAATRLQVLLDARRNRPAG